MHSTAVAAYTHLVTQTTLVTVSITTVCTKYTLCVCSINGSCAVQLNDNIHSVPVVKSYTAAIFYANLKVRIFQSYSLISTFHKPHQQYPEISGKLQNISNIFYKTNSYDIQFNKDPLQAAWWIIST